ncbi:hypothetical protein OAM01_01835 [bacterium]|nr:hypothetical protein [bacterium]
MRALVLLTTPIIAFAQVNQLKIEHKGSDQVQLTWNDDADVVIESSSSPEGPWLPLKPPFSYQTPLSLDTRAGLALHIAPEEAPIETGVHYFRLKEATVYDIQPESGFVGNLNDSNAFVALIVGSDECVAYVCNGDEEISEWFRGPVTDPLTIELENEQSGALFSATFSMLHYTYSGEVVLSSGAEHDFSLIPNHTENAGIYRVVDEEATAKSIDAGWIVNELEEEIGALRISSRFSKAPKIKEVKDGTSNTVLIGEVIRVKAFRFAIRRRLNRRSFIELFSSSR